MKYKSGNNVFGFLLPKCSLSYLKICKYSKCLENSFLNNFNEWVA